MRRPLDLTFPRQRGWPRWTIAVSILLHLLIFLVPIESRFPAARLPEERIVALPPSPSKPSPDDRVRFELQARARPAERAPVPLAGTPRRVTAPPLERGEGVPPEVRAELADSGTVGGERRVVGRVAPQYGQGLLWVRPVPVSPGDLARRLEAEHFELVDSAVTVLMQAFLDSIAAEPGADRLTLPSWTTNVAGTKFGLDSRYIYIAGLKIPAAILALLPLPQGNIDQAKAYNHLMDLRADIERAARRAENMEEFKRAIRDTRERNQRQRDFERAQREPPPPRDQPER